MVGVALPWSELPETLLAAHGLADRVYAAGGGREVRFLWRAEPTLLPVWRHGRLHVVRWGSRDRRGPLPYGGWTWRATVEAGGWAGRRAEPVDVPAAAIWSGGVWVKVRHGVRGLLVEAAGGPVVYVICEPPTRYFRVLTGSEFQPVLIGQLI